MIPDRDPTDEYVLRIVQAPVGSDATRGVASGSGSMTPLLREYIGMGQ